MLDFQVGKEYLVQLVDGFVYRGVVDVVLEKEIMLDGTVAFGDMMKIDFQSIDKALCLDEGYVVDSEVFMFYFHSIRVNTPAYVYEKDMNTLEESQIVYVIARNEDTVFYDKHRDNDSLITPTDVEFEYCFELQTNEDSYYIYIQ